MCLFNAYFTTESVANLQDDIKIFFTRNLPSNLYLSRTVVGNKIVDHSDVVEHRLSALLQLYLHSQINTWFQWIGQRQLQDVTRISSVLEFGASYIRDFTVNPIFMQSCSVVIYGVTIDHKSIFNMRVTPAIIFIAWINFNPSMED